MATTIMMNKDKEDYSNNDPVTIHAADEDDDKSSKSSTSKDDNANSENENENENEKNLLLKQTIRYYGERLSAAPQDGASASVVVFCELLIYESETETATESNSKIRTNTTTTTQNNNNNSDDDDDEKKKKKKKKLFRPDGAYWRKIPPPVNDYSGGDDDYDKSVDNDNGGTDTDTDNLLSKEEELLLREQLLTDVFLYGNDDRNNNNNNNNNDNDNDNYNYNDNYNDNDNNNNNKTNEQQQRRRQSCCRIRRHRVCNIIKNNKRLSSSSSSSSLLPTIDEIVTVRFDDIALPNNTSDKIRSFTGIMCWYRMHDSKNKNNPGGINYRQHDESTATTTTTKMFNNSYNKEDSFLINATEHIATTYSFLVLVSDTNIGSSSVRKSQDQPRQRQRQRRSTTNSNKDTKRRQYRHDRRDIEEGTTTTTTKIDDTTIQQPLEITQNEHEHEHEQQQQHLLSRQSRVVVEGAKTWFCCITNEIKKDFIAYIIKFKGKGGGNTFDLCPKSLDWKQTIFTFIGSFITIYIINLFNTYLNDRRYTIIPIPDTSTNNTDTVGAIATDFGDDKNDKAAETALIMGPFGATVILIFAMTSMSPSQPRSTIGGALCGMIIGKVISYSSLYGVPLGVRMALATSLTAAVMAKMCIIYPPGGALALIFSSQLLGWDKVILQLFGTILTLSLGVIINNLHPLRCYPAYWLGIDTNKLLSCHSSTTATTTATTAVLREDNNDNNNNDSCNSISDSGLLSSNIDRCGSNSFHDDGSRRIYDEG